MSEPAHDCLEHLAHREHEWSETHGLGCGPYERCWQEWWECVECGAQFTAEELEKQRAMKMWNERRAAGIPIGGPKLKKKKS